MLAGDASYLEVTMLSETFDGKSEQVNSEGDARANPRVVLGPSDHLPTYARPEVGRQALRAPPYIRASLKSRHGNLGRAIRGA